MFLRRPISRRGEGCVSSAILSAGDEICFWWQESRTKEKALRLKPEGFFETPSSIRRFGRFRTGFGAVRLRWRFGLSPAEPAHGVCANAPEDADLRGLGLLGLAVVVLVFRTNEQAVHEYMVALMERVGDGLTEAVERHDAVPLGFRLPLVVRVLPRLLGGDGQHGEIRAVAADLPLLRVFPEEADELDVIEIHDLILLFLPHFLGAPEGGVDTAPKASGCILGGNQSCKGGTGKAEDAKLPGAGIIPKPCPRKGAAEIK